MYNEILDIMNLNSFKYKNHISSCWFILEKNSNNINFVEDWCYYTLYKNKENEYLGSLCIVADEGIFAPLVHKYNLLSFIGSKDYNEIHKQISETGTIELIY